MTSGLRILLLVPFLLLAAAACKKAPDSAVPVPPAGDNLLRGQVIDAGTRAGVPGATVLIEQSVALVTDAEGFYTIDCDAAGQGTYRVRATAAGYGYGVAEAQIEANAARVTLITLQPLAPAITTGPSPTTLTAADPEALVPGAMATLELPADAFPPATPVSFTRITGMAVPGSPPAGHLHLGAVIIQANPSTPGKPLILNLPLPVSDPTLTSLAILFYDFSADHWTATGTATVDPMAGTATVLLSRTGTYALAIGGSFTETDGPAGQTGTIQLPASSSTAILKYLARNDYPGGIPATVSAAYLRGTASQNTSLHGGRVSFADSTAILFDYTGSKPDSVPGTKSTSAGYYKWVPKVGYNSRTLPVTITVRGIRADGTIAKESYADASGWQYIHDQGGGGK